MLALISPFPPSLLLSSTLIRVPAGAAASDEDDWKNFINSEANLSNYYVRSH